MHILLQTGFATRQVQRFLQQPRGDHRALQRQQGSQGLRGALVHFAAKERHAVELHPFGQALDLWRNTARTPHQGDEAGHRQYQ
ncbi:hypothetical protein D3C75_1063270 [compost metagenome]